MSTVFCKYMLIACLERLALCYSGRGPASPGKQNRPLYHFKCPLLEENKQAWSYDNNTGVSVTLEEPQSQSSYFGKRSSRHSPRHRRMFSPQEGCDDASLGFSFPLMRTSCQGPLTSTNPNPAVQMRLLPPFRSTLAFLT